MPVHPASNPQITPLLIPSDEMKLGEGCTARSNDVSRTWDVERRQYCDASVGHEVRDMLEGELERASA
jgi:hypothetical protein